MKRSGKEFVIRIIIMFIGLVIAHLGVTLFLLSDLGADPFNVLIQGLFRTLQKISGSPLLTHGRTHICVCFILIALLYMVDKSYIKAGTILCMICGGPIIDIYTIFLNPLFAAYPSFVFKLIMLALGCVILAFGMTIVIKSDAGTGPNDLVAVAISDKTGKKFSVIRIIVDFSFVLVGFLLGGSFGIGTIICAFLVGPVAGFFLPVNEKNINRIISRFV